MLSIQNAHPRDKFITFEEGPHIYTVHGEQGYTSVTTFNHSHFPEFDSGKIIDNMLKSNKMNDPKYKYYGKTKEDIMNEWKQNGNEASKAGTKMHYDIECFYNGIPVTNNSIEFEFFKRFVEDFPDLHLSSFKTPSERAQLSEENCTDCVSKIHKGVKPYRTEWMVYWEEYKLSGSIDMVFENPDGTLLIYDWKRCKDISHENAFGKYAITPCISHLPDTNFWHYSLQLNLYKTILEQKYDKKVVGLFLVCLHPDNHNKTYERIPVHPLDKEIADLLELRKLELSSQNKPK